MIIMIWFIAIISILVIYWFQYPYIKNKDQHKYINFFNHIKIPLFVLCVIILIYIITRCIEKPELEIDLTPINF